MTPRTIPAVLILVAAFALACRPDQPARTVTPAAAGPTSAARPDQDPAPAESPAPGSSPAPVEARGEPEQGRLAGITAAHNRVRAPLELPALVWSDELARFAQTWANKLQRKGCQLQHRPGSGADAQRYGENIFSMTGQPASVADVVGSWAEEVQGYNARTNRCKGVCGHYTQIVWRASRRLGCAMATCGETEVWVCNYDPPGNFVGERPY